jgi:scyllo-inositol 2-dehydrogenase (NADP+)
VTDLRAAIVGYGLAGSVFHGPLIEATPGLVVGAVVSGDPQRRDDAARAHPGADLLDDADQLLERAGDYDFAVIAAPNRVHAPLARRALDAGLPVVVDKPMATSAAEARELVEHAERRGLPLTVFLNRRWDSDHLTLRRLLAEDKLGQVLRYESRFERWRPALAEGGAWREETPPEEGGGVLLDIGSHLVDQALLLFGPVSEIHAEIEARRGGVADDDSFLALRHASGTYSHLSASLLAAAPGPRLRVLGDRAAYLVEALDGQEAALRAGARPRQGREWGVEPPENWGRLATGDASEPVPSEPGAWPSFYTGFEQALREGTPPPVDPRDAVSGLEIIEAARQAN